MSDDLSSKIDARDVEDYNGEFCFKANSLKKDIKKDVKEFVRRLKEVYFKLGKANLKPYVDGRFILYEDLIKEIDKLAGPELSK